MQGSLFKDERKLDESVVIRELAQGVCRRITRRTIAALQRLTNVCLSGDGSRLKNTWDEICVQVQQEESIFWDAYDNSARAAVAAEVLKLQPLERDAIWLQTPEADDWVCGKRDSNHYPVYDDDIVGYIITEYVYAEAGRWSNSRIRAYIDGSYSDDDDDGY